MHSILSVSLQHDQDVVTARQRAAHVAALLGFDVSEQTRIATAVSEIVRNAFRYGHSGSVQIAIDELARPQRLVVRVEDRGPGIPHLDAVLDGTYRSATGMGIGIAGARTLMDRFTIESSGRGTTVVLEKILPPGAPFVTTQSAASLVDAVNQRRPHGLIEEVQEQNRALLRALDELHRKQLELVHLNRELEDTNRGVVALYAELDEKAEHLRRADELKSRFLSNMTHEFRTPVNAIVGLCNLLVDDRRREGREVEPEITYIRTAADQLAELVDDLLDLAKMEAGKTVVRPAPFDAGKLFGALRGMLRPLLVSRSVSLVFEDIDVPVLFTDEGKVSQILRNLVSNALKFTERGEVRVAATYDASAGTVTFSVADTGIGIAPDDQQRIFEEFAQLEHRLQRGVRGTGLGLTLSRKLAELLGGGLSVDSQLGVGSTFRLTVPLTYRAPGGASASDEPPVEDSARVESDAHGRLVERGSPAMRVLTVDDEEMARYVVRQYLSPVDFDVIEASSAEEGLRLARDRRPDVVLLDLAMPGMGGREALVELRSDPETATIPVLVVTGTVLEPAERSALLVHASGIISKGEVTRDLLPGMVRAAARCADPDRARGENPI
jgi:signal transduction histidine kinase